MNFDFAAMKPVLQAEYDRVMDAYPTDMSEVTACFQKGGDGYARKLAIIEAAAELCPVRLIRYYPFACELDVGEPRGVVWKGLGQRCLEDSGADFTELFSFNTMLREKAHIASFNHFSDFFHSTMDHDLLLSSGFKGVWERCRKLNETESDPEARCWREHVMAACRAVEKIGLRFQRAAQEALKTERDPENAQLLSRMAAGANVPWEKADSFFDALTSIMRTVVIISYLDGVEMTCYGQLDRLLWPYYCRELEAGTLTREEAAYLVAAFLHRSDFHAHFNSERKMYDNSMTVMIGGCDREGHPLYNEITDMILDIYAQHGLITPKLNARACAQSPRAYLRRLADMIVSGRNNIIVENDDAIIPMFRRMGLSEDDARRYAANGCQEVICPNQLHSRAFVYLNMPGVLMDTLTVGFGNTLSDDKKALYRYGNFDVKDFETLEASFLANLRSLIRSITEKFIPFEREQEKLNPELLLSAFTGDCVEKGMDMAAGGARYNHKTLSLVGFGTLCDSLLAMKEAYERGEAKVLYEAARADFAGFEALHAQVSQSRNRFGHSPSADEYARTLAEKLAKVSRGIYNGRGIEWRTSLFTYYLFHLFGIDNGATPDGRRAGKSYSRQMTMAAPPVLTAAAQSMAVLTEADFNDVGMFDFAIPATAVSDELRAAMTDYIGVCLELKLPVLQSNFISRETLQDAMEHPENHGDLVVRVCGYSAYFTELSHSSQKEIMERVQG